MYQMDMQEIFYFQKNFAVEATSENLAKLKTKKRF